MCNLNICVNTSDYDSQNLAVFLMAITSSSYAYNSDGDGVYFNNGILVKSESKLNYLNFESMIKKSEFIITHQRLATSGLTKEYVHPFEEKRFVLVHNGVISNMGDTVKSDTCEFFEKFIKNFKKFKRIGVAIKRTLKKAEGSYSVAIFDKKMQVLYYFKDDKTSISFFVNRKRNFLYITTKGDNKVLLPLLTEDEFLELEIKDRKIYRIEVTKKDRVSVLKLGAIKKNKLWWEDKEKETVNDAEVLREIEENTNAPCVFCGCLTPDYHEQMQNFVCEDCVAGRTYRKYGDELI